MNPAVVLFGVAGYNPKRTISLVLATLVVILSLPFMAVMSMGTDVLSFYLARQMQRLPRPKVFTWVALFLEIPTNGATVPIGHSRCGFGLVLRYPQPGVMRIHGMIALVPMAMKLTTRQP